MKSARLLFLLAALAVACGTAAAQSAPTTITLTPNGSVGTSELVNLGIPFPQGALTDAGRVRILDANVRERLRDREPGEAAWC